MTGPAPESRIVALTAKAAQLARRGRPWFYADDLARRPQRDDDARLIRLHDDRGRDLGLAFCSPASRLVVRRCGPWSDDAVPAPEAFLERRLTTALAQRSGRHAGPRSAYRIVHGEADGLPGLVVDRYADCVVVQVTSAVVEAWTDLLVERLDALLSPRMILARNDVAARKFERLPQEVRLLHGKRVEAVDVEEHGVVHRVDPFAGHKTGFYLDQEPARGLVRRLARGARVLDLFAYQGAFSLAALAGDAASAVAVDQSGPALERAVAAAERAGHADRLTTRAANAFDVVRELHDGGAQFDLVVVDPPAFAKSRREVDGAVRGYRDLNRRAIRLLAPGGRLLTCSCSHHLTGPMFEDVVRQAAGDLPFTLVLRQRVMAGADHPVWVSLPESEYLKSHLYERLGE